MTHPIVNGLVACSSIDFILSSRLDKLVKLVDTLYVMCQVRALNLRELHSQHVLLENLPEMLNSEGEVLDLFVKLD